MKFTSRTPVRVSVTLEVICEYQEAGKVLNTIDELMKRYGYCWLGEERMGGSISSHWAKLHGIDPDAKREER